MTHDQIIQAYQIMKDKGVQRFGLHTMVASNELNPDSFVETARLLFQLVLEVYETVGVKIEFINMGGGIGIPYQLDQEKVDLVRVSQGIQEEYR